MSAVDYILIALIAVAFIISLRSAIKNKGCCGDCKNCSKNCNSRKNK
ncbi:MAG: FeoB-associated Cys-rich membrane protein [Ruminococcus sp.]|nr:FeoB-associated Cys-rich membrane protein [Ruminococcus sp.]